MESISASRLTILWLLPVGILCSTLTAPVLANHAKGTRLVEQNKHHDLIKRGLGFLYGSDSVETEEEQLRSSPTNATVTHAPFLDFNSSRNKQEEIIEKKADLHKETGTRDDTSHEEEKEEEAKIIEEVEGLFSFEEEVDVIDPTAENSHEGNQKASTIETASSNTTHQNSSGPPNKELSNQSVIQVPTEDSQTDSNYTVVVSTTSVPSHSVVPDVDVKTQNDTEAPTIASGSGNPVEKESSSPVSPSVTAQLGGSSAVIVDAQNSSMLAFRVVETASSTTSNLSANHENIKVGSNGKENGKLDHSFAFPRAPAPDEEVLAGQLIQAELEVEELEEEEEEEHRTPTPNDEDNVYMEDISSAQTSNTTDLELEDEMNVNFNGDDQAALEDMEEVNEEWVKLKEEDERQAELLDNADAEETTDGDNHIKTEEEIWEDRMLACFKDMATADQNGDNFMSPHEYAEFCNLYANRIFVSQNILQTKPRWRLEELFEDLILEDRFGDASEQVNIYGVRFETLEALSHNQNEYLQKICSETETILREIGPKQSGGEDRSAEGCELHKKHEETGSIVYHGQKPVLDTNSTIEDQATEVVEKAAITSGDTHVSSLLSWLSPTVQTLDRTEVENADNRVGHRYLKGRPKSGG